MTDERRAQIDRALDATLPIDPGARMRYLDALCGDDFTLRREVEEMLAERMPSASSLGIPRASRRQQFEPGAVLAGRFSIVRFVAHGGMGEVYEASDLYLQGKHVALKTILPEIAADPSVRHRFEREVLLTREISHPNVCPMYDIFQEEGPYGRVYFLTMRLVLGESLAQRLKRAGKIHHAEALPLARQISEALTAAHRAGVIHRDLKPNNVMLEGEPDDLRVIVTDFGLARFYEADVSVMGSGHILGTPGYIAPELYSGQAASPLSDVYAFGVVLHEMVIGRKPVSKPGKMVEPVPPITLVPELPRAWNRMLLGCLEPDPDRRFQSSGEALLALEGSLTYSSRSQSIRLPGAFSRRGLPRFFWPALAAVLVIVIAAGIWLSRDRIIFALHPLPAKRYVAMLAWPKPVAADVPLLDGSMDAVAAALSTDEAKDHALFVVPLEELRKHPPADPTEVHDTFGANLILASHLQHRGGRLVLSLSVLNSSDLQRIRSASVDCADSQPAVLPGLAIAEAARLLSVSLRGTPAPNPSLDVGPVAYGAFLAAEAASQKPNGEGIDEAISKYKEALDAEPRYGLAYARLAEAYLALYHETHRPAAIDLAEENARRALTLSPGLIETQLAAADIDALGRHSASGIERLKALLASHPDQPTALAHLALAYSRQGQYADAERVYQRILDVRPNDWLAYNDLGWLFFEQGRYPEAVRQFERASASAPKSVLPLINLGGIQVYAGKYQDAIATLTRAIDLRPTGEAYTNLGNAYFFQGNYRQALDPYRQATEIDPRADSNWGNLGDCYVKLGNTTAATEAYARAEQTAEEALAVNNGNVGLTLSLALYKAKLGKSAEVPPLIASARSLGVLGLNEQLTAAEALALSGNRDAALDAIAACLKIGLTPELAAKTPEFASLLPDPRFKAMIAKKK